LTEVIELLKRPFHQPTLFSRIGHAFLWTEDTFLDEHNGASIGSPCPIHRFNMRPPILSYFRDT
jgi:hypothetical protein